MEKVQGIVYAYTPEKRYDMVRDLGIDWIRLNVPFPWTDRLDGTISPRWESVKAAIREAAEAGLSVMPSTPTILDYPESICGTYGTPGFYDAVRRTTRFMAADLGPLAPSLWQCMNELDIPTFSGDVPLAICAETCRQSAYGILDENPAAVCGTNFASWRPESRAVGELLFSGAHPFGYVGDDQYFGSWQGGVVEDWVGVLDDMWAAFGLPILVNEWGYSSRGETLPASAIPAVLPPHRNPVCCNKAWYNEVEGGHTETVQAEYFRRGLAIFRSHPHVLGNFLFCFSDARRCWQCGEEDCPAECYWGLTDVNCVPKPAYYAVRSILRGTDA